MELHTDILIVGGGVGGCAAALAAANSGLRVVLTEESDWLGGQLTSQATPPDEHGWIEHFGCTRTYRAMREAVRNHYREFYPLKAAARANPYLNPGNGWVSPLCAEPVVFLKVLEGMLSEHVNRSNLQIFREHYPTRADADFDQIRAVKFRNLRSGDEVAIHATYFIDATELGEVLPLAGVEFITGSECRHETGEPSAKPEADAANSQAFSVCFALSHHEGEDHTIEKPSRYEFWKEFVPQLTPPWSGPLVGLNGISPRTMEPITYNFAPHREPSTAFAGLWTYRRIVDRENFEPGTYASDVSLVNYPQIDYFLEDLSNAGTYEEKCRLVDEAKQLSLSFVHWLQTEAGFKGLKLRSDIVGETTDGLAKMPYIRESRRIKAEFTVREQHVSAALRPGEKLASRFADTIGIGSYRIDLHPSVGGDNYVDVESLPFQIPLGALIPQRVENLIAGCKNIGTTHITNGCYRLHPVEWNIGEAAGNLAAFCIERDRDPRAVRNDKTLLADFQQRLVAQGVELEWPADIDLKDGDPHRHAM